MIRSGFSPSADCSICFRSHCQDSANLQESSAYLWMSVSSLSIRYPSIILIPPPVPCTRPYWNTCFAKVFNIPVYCPAGYLKFSASSGAVVFSSTCSKIDNIPISLSIFIIPLHTHIISNTTRHLYVMFIISTKKFSVNKKAYEHQVLFPMSKTL